MSGSGALRFLHRLIRTLTLPNNAGLNDSAIIIGPDLPPCMQARYASAIFWRATNTGTDGINGKPSYYIGQVKTTFGTNQVEEGWALYDGATICGYVVTKIRLAQSVAGAIITEELWQPRPPGGVATYSGNAILVAVIGDDVLGVESSFGIGVGGTSPKWTPYSIDGVSMARALADQVGSTVNTAAIGAEAVVLTSNAITWFDGRCYAVTFQQLTQGSVANFVDFLIRRNSLVGAAKGQARHPNGVVSADTLNHIIYIRNNSGADITDNIVLTMTASAGTVTGIGNANNVRTLQIRDCGSSTDYPLAAQI